jgi:hypothetical protein
MKRGEVWTVSGGGPYTGKPRPSVIVQEDRFQATNSITLCAFTTDPTEAPLLRMLVLGLPIFSRFRLITDYPHNALWLIPDTNALAQPFGKDRSGLIGLPSGDRVKVLLVAPGSPAEKAGWKEGTEIIAVDGHKIDANFKASAQAQWGEQPGGTVITLTLADGTTQQLILADYY